MADHHNETEPRLLTTPFRAGKFQSEVYEMQARHRAAQKRIEAASNQTGTADKWQLLRALTEARHSYNLSDRTIAVLEALLSFQPGKELDGTAALIVFPSNAELSLRCRGMAPATLRRHIAALVAAGFVIRRDSPNGKRYARRDEKGALEAAYGFDLAPFVLAAPHIYSRAEKARSEALALRKMRATITCHLRDIRLIVDAGLSERESDPDTWSAFADALGALSGRLPRNATLAELEPRRAALAQLQSDIERAWLAGLDLEDEWPEDLETKEMSANDANNERHIHNSKADNNLELSIENKKKAKGELHNEAEGGLAVPPIASVLTACPQIIDYAKNGVSNWTDLLAAAELVRTMLGVSASAWSEACIVMGPRGAAVVVAAMLERAETIKSPGGYIRALTLRAEDNQFTLAPWLKALMNERAGEVSDGPRPNSWLS